MSKTLIIGATSAIAEATAREWVKRNKTEAFILVGRNDKKLEEIALDLKARGAKNVFVYKADLSDIEQVEHLIKKICSEHKDVDRVLIAHGTLPDQNEMSENTGETIFHFMVNATSTIGILNEIAKELSIKGSGQIGVITSVAGDRGRKSNYLYGSAKSAVSTFADGLRLYLADKGVSVTIIKPGFVDTPMTANFKKGLLWAQPEKVAISIANAMASKKSNVYIPGFWMPIMFIIKHIPDFIFKRLPL